ncbi:MAG TPA: lysyl oxidase family protein [Nannocystaceae bacterium]|nr:lysyl oxidase family protein [Nannocystaceae bacterium]
MRNVRLVKSLSLLALLATVSCKDDGPAQSDDSTSSSAGADSSSSTTGIPTTVPETPTLMMPAMDAEDIAVDTTLCWNEVDEPGNVRYRVYVEGIELTQGKLGVDGFEGGCTPALSLEFDHPYTWSVLAFRPDNPELASPMSDEWGFHTQWDGDSKILFEDDFAEDLGWTFSGKADDGDWERGNPVPTMFDGHMAQPDDCAGGNECMFTGQNMDADAEVGDVDNGAVTITSPEFDPSGSRSVTVSFARWFFRSDYMQTGASLRVELLVPDENALDGVGVYVLEKLDNGADAVAAGVWTPVAYSACDVPYVPGTKLRITAENPDGLPEEIVQVVEAAIDNVVVTGHKVTDDCQTGVGALCNPNNPICDDGLLCCAQGVLNEGIFRCDAPVAAIDAVNPGAPGEPLNGDMGCDAPDLALDTTMIETVFDEVYVDPNSCTLIEQCVGGPGQRELLRFDMYTVNAGSKNLDLGFPGNHLDLYHFSDCHMHYHFDGYARYALVDDAGEIIAPGHKQAFCLWDGGSWAWPTMQGWDTGDGSDSVYSCYSQGVQVGWYDEYYKELDCQWIDITDIPPGDYKIRIEVNLPRQDMAVPALVERDYTNNMVEIPVSIP